MATIKKKIWPEYFDAVASGKKKYELRVNDFDVAEGDTLVLEEWDPEKNDYTGRSISRTVTFVGRFKLDDLRRFVGSGGLAVLETKGIQVISLE